MTIDELRRVHRAQPFEPFILCLADGRSLVVAHPEAMAFSPTGRTVFVYPPDGNFAIVDLLLVTSILINRANGGEAA
jgi:hypothetical protein